MHPDTPMVGSSKTFRDADPPAEPLTEAEITRMFRMPPHRHIDIGHSRLAYFRFGRGPDLVLVHGWPLHSATFRRILPELVSDFTCHLIDLPGAGRTSSMRGAPISIESHARGLRSAIDQLGLRRYALLAHDSGAVIARLLAATDARVSALVMGNSEIPGHRPWVLELYCALARLSVTRWLLMSTMRSRAVRRSFLAYGDCFGDVRYLDGEFHELFVAPLLASPAAAMRQWQLVRDFDWRLIDSLATVHGEIHAPVQMIWGSEDPFFPLEKAKRTLPQFAGGATLQDIPGAKLFAHEDRPVEFVAIAKPFLLMHAKAESS
jgi:haloalkane dehalogenase